MATGLEKAVFIPIPKKGNAKECSKYCTIALISHASKVMLKIQRDRGIWSHHFMANRWGNSENSDDFILGGSKITADGDYSHEIKRCLLLGRKAMTNPDSILKSRDITLLTKVYLVKAMVFPVVMHVCES